MPKKKNFLDQFAGLTWKDLDEWAGSRIVARGKTYQRQGRVRDLAVTEDNGLIAWVDGTKKYATRVVIDDGLPDSICTCPYELDCKHGVAVVIEYLQRIEDNQPVARTGRDDARLQILEDEAEDDEPVDEEAAVSGDVRKEIDPFLKSHTKAQLIDLINEIAQQHPEVAQGLVDRWQLTSGHIKALVSRLRREIQALADEPGWQDYWRDEGYTPDYSGIRKKLETLLEAGHADEVLILGRELVSTGIRQVQESHDDGETAMAVAACMPVVVQALDQSSLDTADKLTWALEAELADPYDLCEDLVVYLLHRRHPQAAWNTLADRLLLRLQALPHPQDLDDFSHRYARDRLSDWAIHALERSGRKAEIIPLCESEAQKTASYERLVKLLVSARRHEEAEHWIREGLRVLKDKWPGIRAGLRNKLREIRTRRQDWPVVAAIQVEEFVRYPSRQAFTNCQEAAARVKAWPQVRESLLQYHEKGTLPWQQKDWPLPDSGLDAPEPERHNRYPMVTGLIKLSILEKNPERVLYWYDRLPRIDSGWYGGIDDEVATAVQSQAPERAVVIWKNLAEKLIAQVKPKSYQEAAKYLRKAAGVMAAEKKQLKWDQYLHSLREQHARKIRLLEILDNLDDKPIIKKRR